MSLSKTNRLRLDLHIGSHDPQLFLSVLTDYDSATPKICHIMWPTRHIAGMPRCSCIRLPSLKLFLVSYPWAPFLLLFCKLAADTQSVSLSNALTSNNPFNHTFQHFTSNKFMVYVLTPQNNHVHLSLDLQIKTDHYPSPSLWALKETMISWSCNFNLQTS